MIWKPHTNSGFTLPQMIRALTPALQRASDITLVGSRDNTQVEVFGMEFWGRTYTEESSELDSLLSELRNPRSLSLINLDFHTRDEVSLSSIATFSTIQTLVLHGCSRLWTSQYDMFGVVASLPMLSTLIVSSRPSQPISGNFSLLIHATSLTNLRLISVILDYFYES